jgi:hypothetical protein
MNLLMDWENRIIHVPKSELTLVQSSPSYVYNMDLNEFRLSLKNLEDDEAGMVYPDTHQHNTTVTISGLTLARVVEVINNYVVEFEDGVYAVNLIGANSNLLDVAIQNQVSIRANNSAGLIEVATGTLAPNDIELISDKSAQKTWEELLANHTTSGSFGEYVGKKLLSIKTFLGLK